ncbi:MAG: hypothetical protein ACRYG2_33855, partial [Janthinobacterium lividum]
RAARAADLSERSLTELAELFQTDKWGAHRYTPHYEAMLGPLKRRRFALLEIGIGGYNHEGQGGASLRMWKAFFPRAQVIGLDIEDKSFVDEDRIVTYQGSQTDPEVLDRILAEHPVSVVVDDGSHRSEHILETFAHLVPRLPDGAVYAIEDTQTSYWASYGGSTDPRAPTTMNLVRDLLDDLNWEDHTREDHTPSFSEEQVVELHAYRNLVILKKGRNVERHGRRHPAARLASDEKDARRTGSATPDS